jgi:L-fucose isomerase-like protein
MPLDNALRIGFVPANRRYFSTEMASRTRSETIAALRKLAIEVVVPDESLTEAGCVKNREEGRKCAELFRREGVDGIVVGAMNFGDEQGVGITVRTARLEVPILLFGGQEEEVLTRATPRRDSFCGLISIAEALRQIDVKYTVAQRPICFPTDASFAEELQRFAAVCRLVKGIRNARYGLVGTRPEAFWTCRTDEVALQQFGPTTVTLDLSEALAAMREMSADDPDVRQNLTELKATTDVSAIGDEDALVRLCVLETFLRHFAEGNALNAIAVQCWSALQQEWGTCACTPLSRLSNSGLPAACEADVLGAASMHALQIASGTPAGLADWNNLHNEDDDLVNIWHCSAFAGCFAGETPRLCRNEILGQNFGYERVAGTLEFRMKPQPVTLFRLSHDPKTGFCTCVAHGQVEDDPAETFGAYGWCRIPGLLPFYRNVILRHFPHHVAFTAGRVGAALEEAFGNYLGTQVFAPE